VTASTATVDGCTMYLDTSNPPTTAQSTYSVTTSVTLYAQAKGCSTYSDSAVASATYTLTCASGACSDNFTGTSGTLLSTHDASWTSMGANYNTAKFTLNGSGNVKVPTYSTGGGAYYAASTSDTSQATWIATSGAVISKGVCVRANGSGTTLSTGYCEYLGTVVGANETRVYWVKNGGGGSNISGQAIPWASNHVLKIVASGTSTVTLSLYVDGTLVGTGTDSSSPITSGSPGIFSNTGAGTGVATDGNLAAWSDH
jgi:hypothetical protein